MKLIFLTLTVLLFNACSSKKLSNGDHIAYAKIHMKEAEKLDFLIQELDMVIYDRTKSELERDDIRRRYALSLSAVVSNLSKSLKKVDKAALNKRYPLANIDDFALFANELQNNARVIKKSADFYELERLSGQLQRLEKTCTSCHTYIGSLHE